jgi:hypothetical protein
LIPNQLRVIQSLKDGVVDSSTIFGYFLTWSNGDSFDSCFIAYDVLSALLEVMVLFVSMQQALSFNYAPSQKKDER